MKTFESLGYDEAEKAIAAGIAAARRFGRPMAFAVMDHSGEPIKTLRMDGVPARVYHQAVRKAYTAAKMGRNTLTFKRDLEDRANTLGDWNDAAYTTLQGGLVAKAADAPGVIERVLGSIACGGAATVELDEEVARIMLRAIGLEPMKDPRRAIAWRAQPFRQNETQRFAARLPLGAHAAKWLAAGQEPLVAARLRGVVHTSGISGIDPRTGELSADPERQFAQAFENLRALLEAAGVSRAEEIGIVTVNIPDASYRKYINKPWLDLLQGAARPARKTNQMPLPEGIVVQLQAVAIPGAALASVEIPGLFHRDPLPMGATLGPLAFSSVIGGQDPADGQMVADPVRQIQCAFDNIGRFMQAAGGRLDQVNHVWVFMQPHFPYHDQMVETWLRTFPDEHSRPARKTVPYPGLSGDTHIQVQVTGVLQNERRVNYEIEGVPHIDPIPMGARIGRFLHSSGIGGLDPAKGRNWTPPAIHSTAELMVNGLAAQADYAIEHVGTLMRNADGSLDDIAALTVLVQRLTDAPAVMKRLEQAFPDTNSMPALRFVRYSLPEHLELQLHVSAVVSG